MLCVKNELTVERCSDSYKFCGCCVGDAILWRAPLCYKLNDHVLLSSSHDYSHFKDLVLFPLISDG